MQCVPRDTMGASIERSTADNARLKYRTTSGQSLASSPRHLAMPRQVRHWLLKSEPESFSIHDLAHAKGSTTCWDGVRNYQARNFLRDEMQVGDRVLYYHSGGNAPAVVGTAAVVRSGYPDDTAWNPADAHYDPKSTPDSPVWYMVDIELDSIFPNPLALAELRGIAALRKMELLRRGSRLSVQPVSRAEFDTIVELASQSDTPLLAGRSKQPLSRKKIAAKKKTSSRRRK